MAEKPILLETTRRIRGSREPFSQVPIVALTAHAMSGDRERFLLAGMTDYIAKPVDQETLLEVIYRTVEGRGKSSPC